MLRPLTLILLLSAAPAALAQTPGLVVLNKSDDTALVLDRETGEVLATLPTGREPHEVAVSPDGRRALITNYGAQGAPGSTLTVLELDSLAVAATIDLGEYTRPHGVLWLDDARAAVTAEGAQALIAVDVDAGEVVQAVETGRRVSHMVAVTPDGRRAFVPDLGSGTVAVIDLEGGFVVAHLETGAGAEGVAVSPDGREVWITNRADDTVSVVDTESLEVVATLGAGAFPIRAHFSPDGARVLVSNARSGEVSVYDAATREETARVRMDADLADDGAPDRYFAGQFEGSPIPIGLAVSPDGRRAYVANSNADVVVVLDLETLQPVARFATGRQPDGIAVIPVRAAPSEAGAFLLDGSRLAPMTLTYRASMSVMGQRMSLEQTRRVEEAEHFGEPVWRLTDTSEVLGVPVTDEFVVHRGDLRPIRRSLRQGPQTISVAYQGGSVVAQLGALGEVRGAHDGPIAGDGAALDLGLGTLPLAEGFTASFHAFDLVAGAVRPYTLAVTGTENVTVPAGTFETFVVEITPEGGGAATAYVSREAPRVVVRGVAPLPAQMGGGTVTSELTALEED